MENLPQVWLALGPVIGGAIGAIGVAWFTNWFAARREHRNWLHQQRHDCYVDMLDLILANQEMLGARDRVTQEFLPVEEQTRRIHMSHRMKLLAPTATREAHWKYHLIIMREIQPPVEWWEVDGHNQADDARDELIRHMQHDIQNPTLK